MAGTESSTAAKPANELSNDWIHQCAQEVGDQVVNAIRAERLFRATMGLSGLLKLLDASESARRNIEQYAGDFPVPIAQGLEAELRCAARFCADELFYEVEQMVTANKGQNCVVFHTDGPWSGLYSKKKYGAMRSSPTA